MIPGFPSAHWPSRVIESMLVPPDTVYLIADPTMFGDPVTQAIVPPGYAARLERSLLIDQAARAAVQEGMLDTLLNLVRATGEWPLPDSPPASRLVREAVADVQVEMFLLARVNERVKAELIGTLAGANLTGLLNAPRMEVFAPTWPGLRADAVAVTTTSSTPGPITYDDVRAAIRKAMNTHCEEGPR